MELHKKIYKAYIIILYLSLGLGVLGIFYDVAYYQAFTNLFAVIVILMSWKNTSKEKSFKIDQERLYNIACLLGALLVMLTFSENETILAYINVNIICLVLILFTIMYSVKSLPRQ